MKKLLLQALLATVTIAGISGTALAMQPKKCVLTVDHDDVINVKNKLGVTDYAKMIALVVWNNPRGAVGLLWNYSAIKERGEQTAKKVQGTSNIIYTLAQELKDEGYADLTPLVEKMTAITIKPTPIWSTINHLKELKAQGYTIIGATNQDYHQNKYFRERMEAQGVKFDEFFDAVMVAHTILKAQELPATTELVHLLGAHKNIYMPSSPDGNKPHADYYTALKLVALKYNPHAQTFVHSDDKAENIDGACKVTGFKAAHFDLPGGKSARRCTPTELDATFTQWKSEIQKHI